MPTCKNDTTKKYKGTEPSPKGRGYCAHAEKVGTIKKGTDKNKWEVTEVKNGSRRWIKVKESSKFKLDCSKFVVYSVKTNKGTYHYYGLQFREGYMYAQIGKNRYEKKEMEIPKGAKKERFNKDWLKSFYCNSDLILLLPDNKEYAKIKKSMAPNTKTYFIHDNGGRPFVVYVIPKANKKYQVKIYKLDRDKYLTTNDYKKRRSSRKDTLWKYVTKVGSYNPIKVFIGKSPLNRMTDFSGGHGKYFDGNSILLQITKTKYIHIGNTIYEFKSQNQIVEFVSPVGNSNVPYPFAFDDKGRCFLLIEGDLLESIPETFIGHNKKEYLTRADPYAYFYNLPKKEMKQVKKFKYKVIQDRNI